jgi:hypothetical protein
MSETDTMYQCPPLCTDPTRVRGTAMSLVFDTSRSVAGLGPLLAGWLVTLFGGIGNAAAVIEIFEVASPPGIRFETRSY